MKNKKILLIIPAYNEQDNILNTYEKIKEYNKENKTHYDVIVINDGSKDKTEEILISNKIPYITLIHNLGIGGAVQTGYKYAYENNYDIAVQFDGDGQHDPMYIKDLQACMEQTGADIVIGSRFKTERKPINSRMIGSQLITTAIFLTTKGKYIGDVTSGMRLFNKKMIKRFGYDMHYSPEPDTLAYLLNCGVKIEEVQVQMHERIAGVSYLNFKSSIWYMMKMMFSIFLFQWVRKRGKES